MSKLIELTPQGLRVATKQEIRTRLVQAISNAYGSDINFNSTYPDGIFVDSLTEIINDSLESIQGLSAAFNIKTSHGVMLDTLSNLVNIHRRAATRATGIATINLRQTITPTSLVLRDQNNNIWRSVGRFSEETPEQIRTESSTISFQMRCDSYGNVSEPNSFTIMAPTDSSSISVLPYLDRFIQGSVVEDDISLRHRVIGSPTHNSISVKSHLIGQLLNNQFVLNTKVYSNDTDAPLEMKLKRSSDSEYVGEFVTIPQTQLAVIIQHNLALFPGEDNFLEIAQLIFDYKGISTISFSPEGQLKSEHYNSFSVDNIYTPDVKHNVSYIIAQNKSGVVIDVNYHRGANFNSSTTEQKIKDLILKHLGTLSIGEDLIIGSLIIFLMERSNNEFIISNIHADRNSRINYDEIFPTTLFSDSNPEGVKINVASIEEGDS